MLPVHKVLLIALDAMLLHRFQPTRVPRFDLFFALFVENRSDFAEVSVNPSFRLRLLKSYKIALVVVEYPGEDWILTEIIEASTAEFVQLKKELLVLNLTLEPGIEYV